MKKNSALETTGAITVILGVIGMLVCMPVITFGLAYFGGWILKVFVGDLIVNGLNLIFKTTRFSVELIPLTCATLATIGRYFKSNQTNNNK